MIQSLAFAIATLCISTVGFAQDVETTTSTEMPMTEAQPTPPRAFSIAPVLGAAIFQIEGGGQGWRRDEGGTVGVLLDFHLGAIDLQSGLQFIEAGGKLGTVRETQSTLRLDYLAVPVVIKAFIAQSERKVFLKAGFLPMFNTQAELDGQLATGEKFRRNVSGDFEKYDVMAQVGGGLQSGTGGGTATEDSGYDLGFDLTYNRGLVNINRAAGRSAIHNEGVLASGFVMF